VTVAGDYGGSDFGPSPRPAPTTLDTLALLARCSAAERVVEAVRRMDVPAMAQALIDYDAQTATGKAAL